MHLDRRRVVGATIGLGVVGSLAGVALASPPSGIVSSFPVPKADLAKPVNVSSDGVRFRTDSPTDVAIQTITFQPGGRTGWHHHPGMTIVAVQSGELTLVGPRCYARTYGPGSPRGAVFIESGDRPFEVRNLGTVPATVFAALIAPDADPPAFRIEDDAVACP